MVEAEKRGEEMIDEIRICRSENYVGLCRLGEREYMWKETKRGKGGRLEQRNRMRGKRKETKEGYIRGITVYVGREKGSMFGRIRRKEGREGGNGGCIQ